ncbi:MAG: hypothetical protein WCQ72_03130 [Eubacteriales bacterium]
MRCHHVTVGKLDLEGGVRQSLYNLTFKFNNVVLWQKYPLLTGIGGVQLSLSPETRTFYGQPPLSANVKCCGVKR